MLPTWSSSPSRDAFSDSYSSWTPLLGEECRWQHNVHITESKGRNSVCTALVFAALDRRSLWHWYGVALYSESFLSTEGSNSAAAEAKCDHALENWCEVSFCNLKTKKLDLVQIFVGLFQIFRGFFPSTPWWTFWPSKKVSTLMMLFKSMNKIFKMLWILRPCCAPCQHTGRVLLTRGQSFSSRRTVFVRNAAT